MPLPSFLQRLGFGGAGPQPGAQPVPVSQADLEAIRVRARRRLIGMAVLVGVGVVGFPWLFETKPRPMAMDVQVVQQGASAPVAARSAKVAAAQVKSVTQARTPSNEPEEEIIDEPPVAAGASAAVASSPAAASRPSAGKAVVAKPDGAKANDTKATGAKAEGSKAKPDAPASPAGAARYVVQVGAYTDNAAAHEVRMKAERAGLKTYTQVIGAGADKKIRVRLGPFEDKASADKAVAALRKAGLSGALLTL